MAHLQSLPVDILQEIASHVEPGNDILNFSLTSKWIYLYIALFIYRDIEVRDLRRALKLIHYLLAKPRIARTVHSLVLRPNYLRSSSEKRLAGERELAMAVELLAPNLYQLQTFIWDGLEVPPSRMWANLRLGCPRLKHIGTNLGKQELDPDSELFAFSDLRSFSLTSELHDQHLGLRLFRFDGEKLPEALWDMLIDRSPDLESLVLGDRGAFMHSRRKLDIRPILRARWPRLQSLSISNACIKDFADIMNEVPNKLFTSFIDEHTWTLRRLSYHHFSAPTTDDDYRDPPFLAYRGCSVPISPIRYYHIITLQEISLTSKVFCGAHPLRRVKKYLGFMQNLKKLEVWVDFSGNVQEDLYDYEQRRIPVWYDQVKELREVYESCPRGLESLKLLVSTNPKETFYWRDLPSILRRNNTFRSEHDLRLPQHELKHLEVWKVFKRGDEEMWNAAALVALDEAHDSSALANTPLRASSTPLKPSFPSLESIVLVACLEQWGDFSRVRNEKAQIVQHSTFRVRHHQTVSNHESPSSLPSTKALAKISLPLLDSKVRKNLPGTITTVTLEANERGGEFVSWLLTRRYEVQFVHSSGGHRGYGRKKLVIGQGPGKEGKQPGGVGRGREWRLRLIKPQSSLRRKWRLRLKGRMEGFDEEEAVAVTGEDSMDSVSKRSSFSSISTFFRKP